MSYYANIYVVKDTANPSNEGQVFLYKFGKKIFDKIMEAMQPEFEDEQPINPFDFWQGANFKLKIKKVAGYWNYDSSEFDRPGALLNDDDALEAIWKKEYSLSALVAADQFKTYEDLKKRLDYVLGNKGTPRFQDQETVEEEEDFRAQNRVAEPSFTPKFNSAPTPAPEPSLETTTEEDDALSFFQKLAEED